MTTIFPSARTTAPTCGVFAVDVALVQEWHDYGVRKRPLPAFNRVLFDVDGHRVGWRDIPVDVTNSVHALFFTPALRPGPHVAAIRSGHPDFRLCASAASIAVSRCQGVDPSAVAARRNSLATGNGSSPFSPAFVEGAARFPWLVSIEDGPGTRAGADGSWHAYVPLDPDGPVAARVVFEGAASTNISLSWAHTNPFGGAPADMSVPEGSALLLSGLPDGVAEGEVSVYTNGTPALSYRDGGHAILRFQDAGVFEVSARCVSRGGTRISGTTAVSVVGGSFPGYAPACLAGVPRAWPCPDLPADCELEGDPYTDIARIDGVVEISASDTRGEHVVAARIRGGGPVVATAAVAPFWAVASYGNQCLAVETNEYGTLCRMAVSQQGAPESAVFRIQSYMSSVLFDDFALSRDVPAEAFDRFGHYAYDLLKPDAVPAPCHGIHVYQEGSYVGEAAYGGGELPEEWR